jgi:hypothetical protein
VNLAAGVVATFGTQRGAQARVDHPLAKAALLRLNEAWPASLAFAELFPEALDRARPHWPKASEPESARLLLAEMLNRFHRLALIELHVHPAWFSKHAGERPLACPLVRLQARDQEVLTNRCHCLVRIENPVVRGLLTLMDGTRTRTELLGRAAQLACEHPTVQPVKDRESLDQLLLELGQMALLIE